ncbi:hypothetical protein EH165_13325 [Nakamurella antarctica]|uniref:Esterase n=1 Tax=Nakamurella antarctica TaxID=1902245 RepID=A0A3G8ZZK3_9ACTN|nr:alpha/beta hydrolase-fold protein [Nakamurella antarctica]AZI58981.1 hypothetical protein EH165_13325 [Nakamurella antarctica]
MSQHAEQIGDNGYLGPQIQPTGNLHGKEERFPAAPLLPGPHWADLAGLLDRNILANGSAELRYFESTALEGNRLQDPTMRPIIVYLPESYPRDPAKRYPVIYLLHGAMTDVGYWLKRGRGSGSLLERIDEILAPSQTEVIVVLVDAWTSVGGSQYVNSPAIGRYHDYLVDDVTAFVDDAFRTLRSRQGRAVLGHSSGGFGAWVACTTRPDVFSSLAMLAADCLFEGVFLKTFSPSTRRLRDAYDGSMANFWARHSVVQAARILDAAAPHSGAPVIDRGMWEPQDAPLFDQHMLAAAFTQNANGEAEYLFGRDGRLDLAVWSSWLAHDPVRCASRFASQLRSLSFIALQAGTDDEFFADNGAEALSAELRALGVAHELRVGAGTHEPGDNFDKLFNKLATFVAGEGKSAANDGT